MKYKKTIEAMAKAAYEADPYKEGGIIMDKLKKVKEALEGAVNIPYELEWVPCAGGKVTQNSQAILDIHKKVKKALTTLNEVIERLESEE
jgi:hypothetical protein